MARVRFTPNTTNPPQLTSAEWASLDAKSDAELTIAAESDRDNPPLTEDELARLETVRIVRDVRTRTGLSQARFAGAYHISIGRLRDLEQGRTRADSAMLAYLAVIDREPEAVRRALEGVS